MTEKEKDLTKKVMAWLQRQDSLHPVRIVPGPHGGMKGVSDILICHQGGFVAIELKVGSNKPTKLQSHFMQKIKDAGGSAYVCRSLEEVMDVIN